MSTDPPPSDRMPRRAEPELMDLPLEAEAYAKADFSVVNEAFVLRLLELVGRADRDMSLVDLGTGPGDIPMRILHHRPRWRIVAVDGAPAMLELARRAIRAAGMESAITLVLGDAKETGLPAASFDAVISNSILHHVARPDFFWREVRRLGKPGALVFARDLFRPRTTAEAEAIVARHAGDESPLLKEEFLRSLMAAYTPDEVRCQLGEAGLDLNVAVSSDRHLDIFGVLPAHPG